MSFQSINLPYSIVQVFQNILKNDRLAHAYIFYGKAHNKKEAALEFAKAVNCTQMQYDSCSECLTCRTIQNGNHPDIALIQPQGSVIKIEQLRELKLKFHYQAPAGFTRFVIIEQAEKMRLEAANSLLKFLEEPPSPIVVILLTDQIQSILPTIQSRCQKIRFFHNSLQHRIDYYQQYGYPNHFATILALLNDEHSFTVEELNHLCQTVITLSNHILSDSLDEAFSTVLHWSQSQPPEKNIHLLDTLLYWYREILYLNLTGNHQYFPHWSAILNKQASKQNLNVILLAIENVMIARRLIEKPQFRPQDVFEQMILAIHNQELSHPNDWQLIII